MLGARLSAVAWPPIRIASLRLQAPVCAHMESRVSLLAVYICTSASVAPGARAVVWASGIGAPGSMLQSSGRSHRKV